MNITYIMLTNLEFAIFIFVLIFYIPGRPDTGKQLPYQLLCQSSFGWLIGWLVGLSVQREERIEEGRLMKCFTPENSDIVKQKVITFFNLTFLNYSFWISREKLYIQ